MESQYFGHEHPLVFSEDQPSNQSEDEAAHHCSRCGEAIMSGPSFGCAEEECGFYLHKQCAEAPSQLNHPSHPDHPFSLMPNPPTDEAYGGRFICNFCSEQGTMFVYHCSCKIDLHIKCALFTYNMSQKKLGEYQLQHAADKDDPLISIENGSKELESDTKCFVCWEPLSDFVYYPHDSVCGFNLHKKCAELPFQINYSCHKKHPLILQFIPSFSSCIICHDTGRVVGFCYRCSPCNYVFHIACLSPPSVIEDKGHPHPFILILRTFSFTCDACGIEGSGVPYLCSKCNFLVHKKCISLPRIIRHAWHEHPIFHTYFLERHDSKSWNCVVCLDEVNIEHGSFNCSDCDFIVHVNCALKRKKWYSIIELENEDEKLGDTSALLSDVNSFTVIERNEAGEALKIKHFSHVHDLELDEKIAEDDIYCDGCSLLIISGSVYYCSQCHFFLHKICAEFPKRKHEWDHLCQQPYILISDCIFKCIYCHYVCNGFAYKCDKCRGYICFRCIVPYALTCQGHQHPLSFYLEHNGQCNACGRNVGSAYFCKACEFALDWNCLLLPPKARHKCDQHLLELTYHDDNCYPQSHFCDICEKDRNSSHWFYYCAICDISAHPYCVLGRYPFIKLGKMYKEGDHQHPLTFVKKAYYYPTCFLCSKPCQDLTLECVEFGCDYIVHWECSAPSQLWE